jgi:hypothetical protein
MSDFTVVYFRDQTVVQASSIDDRRRPFMFPMTALWLFACFVMQLSLASHGGNLAFDLAAWIWVGTMWAGWAGCIWLASAIKRDWQKAIVIIAAMAWHVVLMSSVREEPVVRYLIMFGGYGIAQSILFRFLRVPHWTNQGYRLVAPEALRRQFAIVELLVLMTMAAILISAIKRYEPRAGQAFFIGLPIIYLAFATTATLCVHAVTSRSRFFRQACACGVLASIVFGSLLIAELERVLVPTLPISYTWMPYYGIHATFAAAFMMLAVCGASRNHNKAMETSPPQDPMFKTADPPKLDDDESPPSSDLLPFRPRPHT